MPEEEVRLKTQIVVRQDGDGPFWVVIKIIDPLLHAISNGEFPEIVFGPFPTMEEADEKAVKLYEDAIEQGGTVAGGRN